MNSVSRRVKYSDGNAPLWLKRLSQFLFRTYGGAEGYGINFYLGRELWGSTWRCNDRRRMVSFDHSRSANGITETLVTIRRIA